MLSCWPNLLFLLVPYYLYIFFLPWVVRGFGLRIDSVLTLSRPCPATPILIIIIIMCNIRALISVSKALMENIGFFKR